MQTASRTVRRLRLRASSEGAVRRAVVLFEDALRTASLPDGAGRIVIVRRLALGRVDSRLAPQHLALRLEHAFERAAPGCVYAGSADAPTASAVWFRDALDAHTRLALRVAAGEAVDAWYWKLAVNAWEPGTPLLHALRRIMLSVATLPEARTALTRWTADMARAGHAERLVAALHPQDVLPLARAAALPDEVPADFHPRATTDVPRVPNDEPATLWLNPAAAAGPPEDERRPRAKDRAAPDPRRVLLKALVTAAGAGAQSMEHAGTLPASARNSTRPASAEPGSEVIRSATSAAPSRRRPSHVSGSREGNAATRTTAASGVPAPAAFPPCRVDAGRANGDPAAALQGMPWTSPELIARAGGLLFLIPVLERLGYRDWLQAQPEWAPCDIAKRILASVLARLRIAPEDPAWALASCAPHVRSPHRFVAPASWRTGLARGEGRLKAMNIEGTRSLWDASGRLLLGAWTGRCPRPLLAAWRRAEPHPAACPVDDRAALVAAGWLVAVRRWLRRGPRIGLADLVRRPALQALTPTHAELRFEMRTSELRIRRFGLDLDPGWVPWFGRVITFRYE